MSKVFDHLGNEYASEVKMAAAYHISYNTYIKRKKLGWPLEKRLTYVVSPNTSRNKAYDHLGNEYPSFEAMCRHYNQPSGRVNRRLKKGWVLKDALLYDRIEPKKNTDVKNTKEVKTGKLSKPQKTKKNDKIYKYDHKGNKYKTWKDMASAYGLSVRCLTKRLELRWPLKKALTTPPLKKISRHKHYSPIDHLGNRYSSFTAMCKTYNKHPNTVRNRLDRGASVKEALTQAPKVQKINNHPVEKRILAKCGLWAEIIGITKVKADGLKGYTVKFEDGVVVKCKKELFLSGDIYHPNLSTIKINKNFHGFICKKLFKDNKNVFYKCECQTCKKMFKENEPEKYRFIMTPQQMIEHEKGHKNDKA